MTNIQTMNEYAIQCFRDEAQAILDLIPLLDDNFSKAVELIHQCRGKVIVTGVGKSGHVGQKIAATLASTGTPAFFLNPLDAYHGDLGMIAPDDLVLAISYSGNTDELLRIIPSLQERKIKIIGMSSDPNSLLGQNSTYHLTTRVKREADPLNLAPTSSTTATMAMGDALACALIRVRNFRDYDFARFHPGGSLGKRLLTKVRDVMHKENMPLLCRDTTVREAITIITEGDEGLGVVTENDKVCGLVTSGDLRRAFEQYGDTVWTMPVERIMNTHPHTIREDESVSQADELLRRYKIHALVVLDPHDRFSGLIDVIKNNA